MCVLMDTEPWSLYFDSIDDVFLGFDDSGVAVVWNQATRDVTGYTDGELSKMEVPEFFVAGDADRVQSAIATVSETGSVRFDARLVTASGDSRQYEFTLSQFTGDTEVAYGGIGREVSNRDPAENRAEAREQTLRKMYEIIADRQRTFSEQVSSLLSLGRAELDTEYGTLSRIDGEQYIFEYVDTDDDSIQAGDVVPLSATNCERAATTEQTLVLGDIARDAPDQTERRGYAEWGLSCYIGGPVFVDEQVYGTFCFYDTDARKGQFSDWEVTLVDLMSRWVSYELQRQQTTDRLERQNERLEQFASVVSHDLRNPLNVLIGAIDVTQETGDVDHLTRATKAIGRMETLIEDLLTLARSGEIIGDTETVDISVLATQCWESLQTPTATLSVETTHTIQADRTRLQQLLENLFKNAIEHGGDTVTIRVGDLDDGFYVEDDGVGIPEGNRQDVFEGGYSTTTDGTGFGLAIVAEVANAHGWDVRITESREGGARFEVGGVVSQPD